MGLLRKIIGIFFILLAVNSYFKVVEFVLAPILIGGGLCVLGIILFIVSIKSNKLGKGTNLFLALVMVIAGVINVIFREELYAMASLVIIGLLFFLIPSKKGFSSNAAPAPTQKKWSAPSRTSLPASPR